MGWFDWFWPKATRVAERPDQIWLHKQAKLDGIAAAIQQRLDDPEPPVAVVVAAHFSESLEEIRRHLESQGLSRPNVLVSLVGDVEKLQGELSRLLAGTVSDQPLELVVTERHPLPAHEQPLHEFARWLTCRSLITHHLSLDDAVLKQFAGEWVRGVLQRLGMNEREPLQSAMITRRVLAASRKIEKHVIGEVSAKSAEEWLERNCPDLWREKPRP